MPWFGDVDQAVKDMFVYVSTCCKGGYVICTFSSSPTDAEGNSRTERSQGARDLCNEASTSALNLAPPGGRRSHRVVGPTSMSSGHGIIMQPPPRAVASLVHVVRIPRPSCSARGGEHQASGTENGWTRRNFLSDAATKSWSSNALFHHRTTRFDRVHHILRLSISGATRNATPVLFDQHAEGRRMMAQYKRTDWGQ